MALVAGVCARTLPLGLCPRGSQFLVEQVQWEEADSERKNIEWVEPRPPDQFRWPVLLCDFSDGASGEQNNCCPLRRRPEQASQPRLSIGHREATKGDVHPARHSNVRQVICCEPGARAGHVEDSGNNRARQC